MGADNELLPALRAEGVFITPELLEKPSGDSQWV